MGAQRYHVSSMLQRRQHQRQDPDDDHQRRELTRAESSSTLSTLLLVQVLKELVDRETKTDQRRRRPYPRHQRAIVRQPRPIDSQYRRSIWSNVFVERFNRHETLVVSSRRTLFT